MNRENLQRTLNAALIIWIAATGLVSANDDAISTKPDDCGKRSYGITIDLLPTVVSMSAGKVGGSLQAWIGKNHTRVRIVGATMRFPDTLIDNDQFTDKDLKVAAVLVDYFKKEGFTGWWTGTGVEYWSNEISNKANGEKASWSNVVLTAGSGYIHPIDKHLYVEPWLGLHYIINQKNVEAGGVNYEPRRFAAEISVKVGVRW